MVRDKLSKNTSMPNLEKEALRLFRQMTPGQQALAIGWLRQRTKITGSGSIQSEHHQSKE